MSFLFEITENAGWSDQRIDPLLSVRHENLWHTVADDVGVQPMCVQAVESSRHRVYVLGRSDPARALEAALEQPVYAGHFFLNGGRVFDTCPAEEEPEVDRSTFGQEYRVLDPESEDVDTSRLYCTRHCEYYNLETGYGPLMLNWLASAPPLCAIAAYLSRLMLEEGTVKLTQLMDDFTSVDIGPVTFRAPPLRFGPVAPIERWVWDNTALFRDYDYEGTEDFVYGEFATLTFTGFWGWFFRVILALGYVTVYMTQKDLRTVTFKRDPRLISSDLPAVSEPCEARDVLDPDEGGQSSTDEVDCQV